MDPKLLLVMTITLLYKESLLPNKSAGNSSELAKQLINTIKLPEVVTVEIDRGRDALVGLRSTVLWMADNPLDYLYDRAELLQRIRVNVGEDVNLFTAIESVIDKDIDDEQKLLSFILNYRKTLRSHLDHLTVKNILREFSTRATFESESITDWSSFAIEAIEKLEPYTSNSGNEKHPSIVDSVNFGKLEEVADAMAKAKKEMAEDGVLRTGWQALNRMLGGKGFRRGESCVIGALPHNFKTGIVMSLLKHFALYNVPAMRDPNKKPMHLFVSYENEIKDNVLWLYKSLKENETGELVSINDTDIEMAATYVKEALGKNGYHVEMVRIDPSDWSFRDLFDYIMKFEAEGYEIHSLIVDYLNMQSKKGCNQGPMGSEIRDLFRRIRNFTSKRGITFITPHQLSPDAKMLARNGTENLVQEVANKGYYDGCKGIDQEVDIELIINIEKVGLEAYLAIQRGKHRKPELTSAAHLYTVLKFEPIGGILDDINGRDLSRKHVGGAAMADGGGKAWYS